MAGKKGMRTGGQTGPRFTATQREEVLAEVARLDRQGWNQHDIARKIDVAQPTVCGYLAEIREGYRARRGREVEAAVAMRVEQLNQVMAVAWQEYNRSKEDSRQVVQELSKPWQAKDPKTGLPIGVKSDRLVKVKEIVTVAGRLGDVGYLDLIRRCVMDLCKLEGCLPEKVTKIKGVGVSGEVPQEFWDLVQGSIKAEVPDRIEEVLRGKVIHDDPRIRSEEGQPDGG